ncbi:MAG: bifunctional oligoribonuclease and phosphatase NrnA [Bacteroidota bacterium]|nr:bifunctional oligoribonuclease and phosphatase NrnA [Bacteroidota bacterium]
MLEKNGIIDQALIEKSFHENLEICSKLLAKAKNVVITSHINPDGDALGCELALYYYLTSKGAKVDILNYSPLPELYKFMDSDNIIRLYDSALHDGIIAAADTIIIPDLNDVTRIKTLQKPVTESKAKKIVLDHHQEPREFADLYIIDSDASSAGEIIWQLLKMDKDYGMSQKAANALYLAIMTDTGCFRFPRTDSFVHSIIADLIEAGADPVGGYEQVYNRISFGALKLLGEAFAGMEQYFDGRLCLMTLRREHFEKTGTNEDDVENFVEKTLSVNGAKVGILITELPGKSEIRMSFRSKEGYSIRELALHFNGGGHSHAAGARVYDGDFETVKREVLDRCKKLF